MSRLICQYSILVIFLFQTRKETHVPDSPFIRTWPTRQTVRSIISVWDQPSQQRGVLGVTSPLECLDIVSSPTHSQSVLENRSRHDRCVNRPLALSSNPKRLLVLFRLLKQGLCYERRIYPVVHYMQSATFA